MNNASESLGGKAASLRSLEIAGFPVPEWFIVLEDDRLDSLQKRLDKLGASSFAVRSSAAVEDGAAHSFAGQFDSFLFVAPEDVAEKIQAVRESGKSDRIAAYLLQHGLSGAPPIPRVIVQKMILAETAGVAFSADPVGGRRDVAVVSAIWGLGSALVSGEADADSYHIGRDGRTLSVSVAAKPLAHRADATAREGVAWQPVEAGRQNIPCLSDAEAQEIAELARQAERHFGRPQDIEWARHEGRLYLLQSRPITSLANLPDPDDEMCLWDNSNISESYSGVTTPLTFSFARRIYENVYREFCRLLSIPEDRLAVSDRTLANMLGIIRGRIYYNLLNWYRVLAMLPGFRLNRGYMEQMMGVKEPLPDELVRCVMGEIPKSSRVREWWRVGKMLCALVRKHCGLPRQIERFHQRLEAALAAPAVPLEAMRIEQLVQHYHALEAELLRKWDAPLINDFFAMIFFGLLRSRCTKWLEDSDGALANSLVRHSGAIVSLEPWHRIHALAAVARTEEGIREKLATASHVREFSKWPKFQFLLDEYLEKFGDRCLEELKLESPTLGDNPRPLFASIAAVAGQPEKPIPSEENAVVPRLKNPLKRWHFGWVLRHARERVRQRENLRFERTRLFGRVRRIVLEIGKRLQADGRLNLANDVFYFELSEILDLIEGASPADAMRGLVAVRQAIFAGYRIEAAPPDRFLTRGPIHRHAVFEARGMTPREEGAEEMKGLGCCAGVVRGRVRVVLEPQTAILQHGEILVARHTDPGWVMLFPMATGLLVERGSLLSHSAIVAREMGLPAIVGLPGVCEWLRTGEEVEMDGRTGIVRKIAP